MEALSRRVFLSAMTLSVVALLAMTAVSIPMTYAHHPENPPKPSIAKSDEFGTGAFETYMEGATDVSDNEVVVQADGVSYYGSYTWNEWYDINFDGDVDNDSDTWTDTDGNGYVDEGEYTDTNGDSYYSDEWYDWNGNNVQDSDTYTYNYFEASAGGEYCYFDFNGNEECYDYEPTGSLSMTVDGLSGLSFDVDSLYGSMYELGGINVLYYYVYNSDWSDWSEHDGGVIIAQVVTGDDLDLLTTAEGDEEDNLDEITNKHSPGDLLNIKGILYAGDAGAFYAVQYGWCPQFDEYGYYLPADQCDWEAALNDLQTQAIWDETFSGNDKVDNYFLGASEDSQSEENNLVVIGEGSATAKVNKVNTNFDLYVETSAAYTCNSDGTMELDDDEVSGTLEVNDEVIDFEEGKLTVQEKKITLDVKKGGLSSDPKDTLKVTWTGNFDCTDDDEGTDVTLAAGKVVITAKVTTEDTGNKQASLNSKKTGTGEVDYNG